MKVASAIMLLLFTVSLVPVVESGSQEAGYGVRSPSWPTPPEPQNQHAEPVQAVDTPYGWEASGAIESGTTKESEWRLQQTSSFKVGVILPHTGVLSQFGLSMRDAANLAANEINSVPFPGGPLELLHRDSQTNPAAGAAAAQELISEQGTPAIIGAASSGVSQAVAGVTIPNEIPQISPASTSPFFSTFEPEPGWFWRTAYSDTLQGQLAALRTIENGWSEAGLLVVNNPFGVGMAVAFREAFTSGGGTVVAQVNFTEEQPDYTSDLQILADAGPEVVFLAGYPGDALTIMMNWWANVDQPGWGWQWFLSDTLKSQAWVTDLRQQGVDIRGVEGTSLLLSWGPHFEVFRQAYMGVYGREPMIFDAHTYDASYLVVLAAVAGGSTDALTIRDNLISVANPPGDVVGLGPEELERAISILEDGGEVNYQGASSFVNFDSVGDAGTSFEIWQIDAGWQVVQSDTLPEWDIWPPSLDSTAPSVSISSPPSGAFLASEDVTVNWSASDAVSGLDFLEVSLDGGVPTDLPARTFGHTFANIADGPHTVAVTAFDFPGYSQTDTVDFTVDTIPPIVSITAPSSGALLNTNRLDLAWTASDATSGIASIEVTLDEGAPVVLLGSARSHAFLGVSDGSHTVAVTVFDAAGNQQSSSLTATVDATPPTLTILSPSEGEIISSKSVAINWTAADALSGIEHYELSLDGGSPLLLTEDSHTLQDVSDGVHAVTVTAFDVAGNSKLASMSFRVDTNIFSPTGPYGSIPLVALLVAVVAGVAAAVFLLRRRRLG